MLRHQLLNNNNNNPIQDGSIGIICGWGYIKKPRVRWFGLTSNNLARTVLHSGSYSSSKSNLRELHWLPIRERIRYKIANLCYRAVRVGLPLYLAELVREACSFATICWWAYVNCTAYIKTVIADRRFSCVAPHIWNSLPLHFCTASSSDSFRSQRKTHLSSIVFDVHP